MMLSQVTTFTISGRGFTDVAWSPNGTFIATSEQGAYWIYYQNIYC